MDSRTEEGDGWGGDEIEAGLGVVLGDQLRISGQDVDEEDKHFRSSFGLV